MTKLPSFCYEKRLFRKGFDLVLGVDEVGRGAFAGPIVVGAVAFAPITNYKLQKLSVRVDDSKKLSPRQREVAAKWIRGNAQTFGIGEVSASLINRIGMAKATKMAFRRAITSAIRKDIKILGYKANIFLLLDAFYIPYVKGARRKNQLAIINGDEKSLSIAAASIIAKVYRDKIMLGLGKKSKYKKYGWGRNKGYGTKEHRKAIRKYGLTRYHRSDFVNKKS